MPDIMLYGDGTLYADANTYYGRVSATLLAASELKTREIGLEVIVEDPQLNKWEYVGGTHSYPEDGLGRGFYKPANVGTGIPMWDKRYWSYRGLTDLAQLNNGDIIRVRIGDPADINDRQIWIQTITDPSVASQWASWSVQYSGTHYSASVQKNAAGTGVNIYYTKSDGLYRNNTKRWDNTADIYPDWSGTNWIDPDEVFNAVSWIPITGYPDAGWVMITYAHTDGKRVMAYGFSENVVVDAFPSPEYFCYGHVISNITGILMGSEIGIVASTPSYLNPRSTAHGSAMLAWKRPVGAGTFDDMAAYPVRGVGGGGGINYIGNMNLVQLSDGYYYCFGFETHTLPDVDRTEATSLGFGFPIWMRSKDLYHWSDPVVGPGVANSWGFNGVVEKNGYLYWADTEVVYRRPTAVVEYDLSNYVPTLDFELPRDNQAGSGSALVANPSGVNDYLLPLSDKPMTIRPGLRTATGQYEFSSYDQFYMKRVVRETEGEASRLTLEFGNIIDRLENPLRDVTNFIGKFVWDDFAPGRKNQPFNYYFASDSNPTVDSAKRLNARGIVLLTAWKGHNPDIEVQFNLLVGTARIIARYVNARNYVYLSMDSSGTVQLVEKVDNVDNILLNTATTADSSPRLRLRLYWNQWAVYVNDAQISGAFILEWGNHLPGYCGFSGTSYAVGPIHVEDYEYDLQVADLVRTALAMGDFHDVLIDNTTSKVYALIWGPQTDVPTPAEGLKKALEADKLEMTYRDGSITVGRFNDQSNVKTVRDTIIESDEIDEASRRINFASVDGNEHFWLEVDVEDAEERGRMLVSYFDLPELLDQQAVKDRAREEIKRSAKGASPGGTTPLYFDIHRMDTITWVDNRGNSKVVRVEGFAVSISQGEQPHQRQTFDTSEYSISSSDGLIEAESAEE